VKVGYARFARTLLWRVVTVLIVAVPLGWQYPGVAVAFKPRGDGFIELIKIVIVRLVFGVVVRGIVGAAEETVETDPAFEPKVAI
jgi:aerobic C4-dicarboxylate transport protein